jgi:hypothetical protein
MRAKKLKLPKKKLFKPTLIMVCFGPFSNFDDFSRATRNFIEKRTADFMQIGGGQ